MAEMTDVAAGVEALNAKLGRKPRSAPKKTASPAAAKAAPKKKKDVPETPEAHLVGDKVQLEVPLKNGAPYLPASMIRVELGYYEEATQKSTGFTQLGVAVVYIGIPVPRPDGKTEFHPVASLQAKVEYRANEENEITELRLITPFWTKKGGNEDSGVLYTAGCLSFRDRICRTLLTIIKEKRMRPVEDIWAEQREYKVFYDHEVTPKTGEAVPLAE